ncbi:MAG: hypothetical protein PHX21_12760 [bacterium]|nr:hypothetical protein [bacterium]
MDKKKPKCWGEYDEQTATCEDCKKGKNCKTESSSGKAKVLIIVPECFGGYNKAFSGCGICKSAKTCEAKQKTTGQRKISDHGVTPEMQDFISKNPTPNAMNPNTINEALQKSMKGGMDNFSTFAKEVGMPFNIPMGGNGIIGNCMSLGSSLKGMFSIRDVENIYIPILFKIAGFSVLPREAKVPQALLNEFHKFMRDEDENEHPPERLITLMKKFMGKKNDKFPVPSLLFFLHKTVVNGQEVFGMLKKFPIANNMLTIFAYEGTKRALLDLKKKQKIKLPTLTQKQVDEIHKKQPKTKK